MPHIVSGGMKLDSGDVRDSQEMCSDAEPSRFRLASMAACEISRTVIFSYPRARTSSTSVDSPPPTSIIAADFPGPNCSISLSELKVRSIPADGVRSFLRVDSFPMTLRIHIDPSLCYLPQNEPFATPEQNFDLFQ